jgi:hypothetical protein
MFLAYSAMSSYVVLSSCGWCPRATACATTVPVMNGLMKTSVRVE